MAEQTSRQPFRFRLPWVTTRAPTESQPPIQPSTTIPSQRTPFQPTGSAPSLPRPSTQPQAPPRTDSRPSSLPPSRVPSQPSSPTRTGPPSRVPSQPTSLPRTGPPSGVASQPSSPTRTGPPSRVASQPTSLPRTEPPSRVASQPTSPPRTEPASGVASQPSSPTRTRPPSRVPSQPSSPTRTGPPSRVPSQPSSPTRTGPPSRVASQPTSPPRTEPPSRVASQPTSPPRTEPPSRVASQPSSPTRTGLPSRVVASQPTSPPRTEAPSRVASQPSSPSRTAPPLPPPSHIAPQSQTTSLPPSPARTISQTTSKPPSPPHTAPQPVARTTSQSPSPPRTTSQELQAAAQAATLLPSPVRQAPLSQPTALVSSQPPSPSHKASQPVKVDYVVAGAPTITAPKTSPKAQKTKEREQKTTLEPKKEDKLNAPVDEEPKQRTITELPSITPGSIKQTRGQSIFTPQAEEKQLEKLAALDVKKTTEMGFKGRESKVVATHPKDWTAGSESRPRSTTFHGERPPLHKGIREDVSKFVQKLAVGNLKQPIGEIPATVITLVGENTGAAMHLRTKSSKREGPVQIQRGHKLNQDENAEVTNAGDGSSKEDSKTGEAPASTAYINSNVQSINNSLLCGSSISEGNPAVHLSISRKPTEPINLNVETESVEAHKVDFNITPSEKLTYEPPVSSRCTRGGPFLESSYSDPDNPEKPQHHG